VTRFIGYLYTQHVTTSNDDAIAKPHTLQITEAHAKSSQFTFTSRFLVTDLNKGDSSASVLRAFLSGEYPASELNYLGPRLAAISHQPASVLFTA
jgi:hypothetical protein